MNRFLSRALALCFFLTSFQASALKRTASEEKFHDVSLTQTLELDELDQAKLKAVGHALRNKKVAFMNFEVYVGEVLMPTETTWNQKASEFLSASPAGFQMSFLRDVPAEKMMTAFTESLKENDVDTKSESIQAFLKAVKKVGDLKEKDVFLIARKKAEKADQVLILISGRPHEIVSGPAGWSDNIIKIWAGKPADSGLEKMQKELFK
jgi:hypothetical protein